MKRIVAFILAFMYLGMASGATIHLHYCMDKLVSWSLQASADDTCSNCGMAKEKKKGGCCNDEQKEWKAHESHKLTASAAFDFSHPPVVLPVPFYSQDNFYLPLASAKHPFSHAPPGKGAVPAYLFNRIFLI